MGLVRIARLTQALARPSLLVRSEKRVTAALTIANNSGQTYISGTMIIITITIKVMIVYGICFLMC